MDTALFNISIQCDRLYESNWPSIVDSRYQFFKWLLKTTVLNIPLSRLCHLNGHGTNMSDSPHPSLWQHIELLLLMKLFVRKAFIYLHMFDCVLPVCREFLSRLDISLWPHINGIVLMALKQNLDNLQLKFCTYLWKN